MKRWIEPLLISVGFLLAATCAAFTAPVPFTVVLTADVRTELNRRFTQDNASWRGGWDRESLGCLQVTWLGPTAVVTGWVLAPEQKRLHHAVAGTCPAGSMGSWHTHPWDPDPTGDGPRKYRHLSNTDIKNFQDGSLLVALVSWDVDSLDAAVKVGDTLLQSVVVR